MRLKFCCFLALGISVFVSPVSAEISDTYVCLANKSTGFGQISFGNWTIREFDVNLEQHILKPKENKFEWLKPGESTGILCPSFDKSGQLTCSYGYGSILINKISLRYIETYLLGYIEGDDKKATPSITIGECVKM